jgi:hypothetical protein
MLFAKGIDSNRQAHDYPQKNNESSKDINVIIIIITKGNEKK